MSAAEKEDKEWNQFSATQLARHYSPEDSIYDDTSPVKSLGKAMRDLGVTGGGEFTDLSTNSRHMDDFARGV